MAGGARPKLYLISMIDDATSRLHARFVLHDSTEENMRLLWSYLEQHGRPVSFYTDKASLFQTAPKIARDLKELPRDERGQVALTETKFLQRDRRESAPAAHKSGRYPSRSVRPKTWARFCAISETPPPSFFSSLPFRPGKPPALTPPVMAAPDPPQNRREHPRRQMALGQQKPVVPGMFHQPARRSSPAAAVTGYDEFSIFFGSASVSGW